MRKFSNMVIQLFAQYNHIEKESHYWRNPSNDYKLEENNKICIYCSLSAIINYG